MALVAQYRIHSGSGGGVRQELHSGTIASGTLAIVTNMKAPKHVQITYRASVAETDDLLHATISGNTVTISGANKAVDVTITGT